MSDYTLGLNQSSCEEWENKVSELISLDSDYNNMDKSELLKIVSKQHQQLNEIRELWKERKKDYDQTIEYYKHSKNEIEKDLKESKRKQSELEKNNEAFQKQIKNFVAASRKAKQNETSDTRSNVSTPFKQSQAESNFVYDMKMEALQKDKGALQKEIDNLKSQKEEMEMNTSKQIEALQDDLKKASDRYTIEKLSSFNELKDQYRVEKEKLDQEYQDLNNNFKAYMQQYPAQEITALYDEQRKKLEEIKSILPQKDSQLKELSEEIKNLQQKNNALQVELQKKYDEANKYESNRQIAEEQKNSLNEELKQLREQLQIQINQNLELQNTIDQAKQQDIILQTALTQLKEEVARINTDRQSLSEKIQELESALGQALEIHNSKTQKLQEQLDTQLIQNSQLQTNLKESNEKHQKSIQEMIELTSKFDEEKSYLQSQLGIQISNPSELSKINDSKETSHSDVELLQTAQTQLKDVLFKISDELKSERVTSTEQQKRITALEYELSQTQGNSIAVNQLNQKVQALEQAIRMQMAASKLKPICGHGQLVSELKNQITDLVKHRTELEQRVQDMKQKESFVRIENLICERDHLQLRVYQLERQLITV